MAIEDRTFYNCRASDRVDIKVKLSQVQTDKGGDGGAREWNDLSK